MNGTSTITACAVLAVLISGCAKSPSKPTANSNPFKVALLTPSAVNDRGWNALGYDGIQAVKQDLGAEISYKQTTKAEYESDFREYATAGYKVIFAHGYEFQPAALTVSKDFPNTVFVVSAGDKVAGNVVPIIPKLEEATYLIGVLSARLSKTGKAGLVGGMEIPPIKSTFSAFQLGARHASTTFQTKTTYIGSFDDIGSAKEAALAQISQGCDIIFHNADAAGIGAIQACQESPNTLAFGSNRNQNDVAPEVVVASAVLDIPKEFVEIAQSVRDGSFKPKAFRLTLANGHTSLIFNDKLKKRIPASVMREIQALTAKIKSGELKIERAHF